MWRAGLRIQEALALTEGDLDQGRGALPVRRGKRGRRREVGMDAWAWEQLQPWLELRRQLPVGPLLCVIAGATRGRHWSSAAAAPNFDASLWRQECGADSLLTSCAMRTRSRWPLKACR